ncbi:hypothetical protein Pf1_02766 [Flavobacterium columnare]|nr:hypothetical protein Pf1_02766 [Flavobacterium columnare]
MLHDLYSIVSKVLFYFKEKRFFKTRLLNYDSISNSAKK